VASFEKVSQELLPERITKDQDNYKNLIVKIKPELLMIGEKKLRIYS
jgi:hypothetical protein